jgi:isoquinoline 1-oxidoreductase alpha subunit
MAITLTINGQARSLEVEADMPLLWALRENLGMTGTKFGCGIAACGACTVHVNGRAVRSKGLVETKFSRRGSLTRCLSAGTASRA